MKNVVSATFRRLYESSNPLCGFRVAEHIVMNYGAVKTKEKDSLIRLQHCLLLFMIARLFFFLRFTSCQARGPNAKAWGVGFKRVRVLAPEI